MKSTEKVKIRVLATFALLPLVTSLPSIVILTVPSHKISHYWVREWLTEPEEYDDPGHSEEEIEDGDVFHDGGAVVSHPISELSEAAGHLVRTSLSFSCFGFL